MKIKRLRHLKLIIFSTIFVVVAYLYINNNSLFYGTLFENSKKDYHPYLFEDFSTYSSNSEVLDSSLENLSRWSNQGVITAWVDVENWKDVDRIDLKLTDSSGKFILLKGIENVKSEREKNLIKSDEEFNDYYFNCNQSNNKWEDFMIVDGRNLIFWEYNWTVPLNMREITSWEFLNGEDSIKAYDLVIHDGLCKDINSLNGEWSSPNGLPQYGVWWIVDDRGLIMRNVEIEQYPSNGEHTRILSSKKTPENFIMRTRFFVNDLAGNSLLKVPPWILRILKKELKHPLENTYIRFAWDFEDVYDSGHDQSFAYISFQYNYLGFQRVYPIKRYFLQNYEPPPDERIGKTKMKLKKGREYELQLKVDGQDALVEIYEVYGESLRKKGGTSYTFSKERLRGEYPLSFETTGNVEIILKEIEILEKQEM